MKEVESDYASSDNEESKIIKTNIQISDQSSEESVFNDDPSKLRLASMKSRISISKNKNNKSDSDSDDSLLNNPVNDKKKSKISNEESSDEEIKNSNKDNKVKSKQKYSDISDDSNDSDDNDKKSKPKPISKPKYSDISGDSDDSEDSKIEITPIKKPKNTTKPKYSDISDDSDDSDKEINSKPPKTKKNTQNQEISDDESDDESNVEDKIKPKTKTKQKYSDISDDSDDEDKSEKNIKEEPKNNKKQKYSDISESDSDDDIINTNRQRIKISDSSDGDQSEEERVKPKKKKVIISSDSDESIQNNERNRRIFESSDSDPSEEENKKKIPSSRSDSGSKKKIIKKKNKYISSSSEDEVNIIKPPTRNNKKISDISNSSDSNKNNLPMDTKPQKNDLLEKINQKFEENKQKRKNKLKDHNKKRNELQENPIFATHRDYLENFERMMTGKTEHRTRLEQMETTANETFERRRNELNGNTNAEQNLRVEVFLEATTTKGEYREVEKNNLNTLQNHEIELKKSLNRTQDLMELIMNTPSDNTNTELELLEEIEIPIDFGDFVVVRNYEEEIINLELTGMELISGGKGVQRITIGPKSNYYRRNRILKVWGISTNVQPKKTFDQVFSENLQIQNFIKQSEENIGRYMNFNFMN